MRVIESQLVTGISYQLKTEILPFLLSNRIDLLDLAERPHESVAPVFKLKGLDALLDALVRIGFSLALRALLLEGLQHSLRVAGGTAAVQLGEFQFQSQSQSQSVSVSVSVVAALLCSYHDKSCHTII